ncbi:hypothetical protein AMTR_s04032p00000050, partial [Amborella trichopoda]
LVNKAVPRDQANTRPTGVECTSRCIGQLSSLTFSAVVTDDRSGVSRIRSIAIKERGNLSFIYDAMGDTIQRDKSVFVFSASSSLSVASFGLL